MSDSLLVRSVSIYAIYYGRMTSTLGRNAILCCTRFNVVLDDFLLLSRETVYNYNSAKFGQDLISTVSLLLELICVRDGLFTLSMPAHDINELVRLLCTT